MRSAALLLAFFGCSFSHAVYFPLPAGHREAFMANVGGAMESSPGNVLFNPAGLGFRGVDRLNLSVSGTAIAVQELTVPGYDMNPQDLSLRPLMATGIYGTEFGTAAVFVASPMAMDIIGSMNSTVGGYDVSQFYSSSSQVIKMGGAFSSRWTEDMAWGIAGGLQFGNLNSHGYSKIKLGSNLYSTIFSEGEEKRKALFLTPGIMIRPFDFWTVGFSAQVMPVFLESKGVEFTSTHAAATPTTVEENTYSYDPNGTSSIYLRLGQAFKLMGRNTMYLDITHSTASSTKSYDGDENKTSAYTTYALGWRNTSLEGWQPLLGYSYTSHEEQEMHLSTGGVSIIRGKSELILGAYYMASISSAESVAGPEYINYGIMFSSNVAY